MAARLAARLAAARARLRSPLRFLALGGLSFSLNLGVTASLHELFGVGADAAFATGLVTVFVFNFVMLRTYVFPGGARPIASQLAGFGLSSAAFRGLEFCGFLVLHRLLGAPYLLAAAATLSLSMALKYAFYGTWLFAREPGRGP